MGNKEYDVIVVGAGQNEREKRAHMCTELTCNGVTATRIFERIGVPPPRNER